MNVFHRSVFGPPLSSVGEVLKLYKDNKYRYYDSIKFS